MVSTGCPAISFRMARLISMNSADAGFSNFAAIVVLALTRTGSDVLALDAGASAFASIPVDGEFFSAGWGLSRTPAAVERSCALAAMVDLTFIAAELVLGDAGAG